MSSFSVFNILKVGATAALVIASSVALADGPVTQKSNPEQFDIDGKHICGWSVMTESERAGFKSLMHNNKEMADRELIRTENCKAMKKRAQDKGVPLDE
jgi:hypothetical protein